ncbi:unnamed protein product [Nezara viridula]|uniref:Uncharacterized protein n=1 Tax=Nezara viridula TaxID=85310 RepID=A0A9P0H303_NEZVI|nr:unnamed protein product [Nezara viridula]
MFPVRIPGGVLPGAVRAQQQQAKDESEKQKCQVRLEVKPFTRMSVNKQETRSQLVKEYGFQPKRKASVEDGSVLPNKFEPFPRSLYGKPLEEIDNFIYDEEKFSERMKLLLQELNHLLSQENPHAIRCVVGDNRQYLNWSAYLSASTQCGHISGIS